MNTVNTLNTPEKSELGKKTNYISTYDPKQLFSIPRQQKREELGIDSANLPFYGFDYWNHYEISWLNEKGKPTVALAEIIFACDSPNIIESKSMKLYFNSLNDTKFTSSEQVQALIEKDLNIRIGAQVIVKIVSIKNFTEEKIFRGLAGNSIDHLDIECSQYNVDPALLCTENIETEETLYSDLLKSNCLVTGQLIPQIMTTRANKRK